MLAEVNFISALLVGFFGGVHCVGMCGGIVSALTFGLPDDVRARAAAVWPFHLAYNLGRITSYTVAGALAGGLGAGLLQLTDMHSAQQMLQIVAALFMSALGLYLGGWWRGLRHVERAGGALWRRIEPIGRRLLPVTSPALAYVLGLVWGWLPCGLVYSVLIWALSAGSALRGAELMFGFGLGTLPNLLLMGAVAGHLSVFVRRPWPQRLAGGLVLAFAGLMLWRVFSV